MNTTTDEKQFLDVDFEEYSSAGGEWETVPTNWYDLVIEDMTPKEKTDAKLRADLALKQKDYPNTTLEEMDRYQWVWTLRIASGEFEGFAIICKTSRSFHEKSTAGKLAAAALGLAKWDKQAARQIAQAAGKSGTGVLMGRKLRASVTEDPDAQNRMWNNCKEFKPWEPPRTRGQRPQVTNATPTVPQVTVAGLQGGVNTSGGDDVDELWPLDEA